MCASHVVRQQHVVCLFELCLVTHQWAHQTELWFCPGLTLASRQQAMQRKILSGTLKCPPMDFVNYMKHFKLDPLYASVST